MYTTKDYSTDSKDEIVTHCIYEGLSRFYDVDGGEWVDITDEDRDEYSLEAEEMAMDLRMDARRLDE
jgi:hypothetical protein